MDSILESQLRAAVKKLTEGNFQDFLNKLLLKKYKNNFTPIKDKKDKGCDGIINGKKVVAAYAPEKHTLSGFKKKINGDFDLYKKNWSKSYPEWCVYYNEEFTAEAVTHLDGLDAKSGKCDLNHIIEDINSLAWGEQREIERN